MRRQIFVGPNTKTVHLGGRLPRVTKWLLGVQLGVFLIYVFADGPRWITQHVALSHGRALGALEIWQPFTALWLHLDIRPIILNLLALWVFGSALERWWGGKRLLNFFVTTGIVGLAAGMLAGSAAPQTLIAGSAGSAMAMMVAIAMLFSDHLVFIYALLPLKGRWFGLLMAGFVLVGTMLQLAWLDLVVQLAGGVCALLFVRRRLPKPKTPRKPAKSKFHVIRGGKKPTVGKEWLN